MVKHCTFCGASLSEEEQEKSEMLGTQVCDDCLHSGVQLLKKALSRDRG